MTYVESNSHVTDDVTSRDHKSQVVAPIRLEPNISKIAGDAI